MPFPERFTGTDEYYATKLHEFYHATGHETRENRQNKQSQTLKGYAFEEMRAEMFSILAGARLNLPMPESNSAAYIDHWNQKFSAERSRQFPGGNRSGQGADHHAPV
jgi:antirestriction protein ArdC